MRARWKLMMALAVVAAIATVGAFLIVRALLARSEPAIAQTTPIQAGPMTTAEWRSAVTQRAEKLAGKKPFEGEVNGVRLAQSHTMTDLAAAGVCPTDSHTAYATPQQQLDILAEWEPKLTPAYLPKGALRTTTPGTVMGDEFVVCAANGQMTYLRLGYQFPGQPYGLFIGLKTPPIPNDAPLEAIQPITINGYPAVAVSGLANKVIVSVGNFYIMVWDRGPFPMEELIKVAESLPILAGKAQ